MNIEIKNRWTSEIILAGKYANIREAVEKNKKNLQDADLQDANLQGADLQDADLQGADLRGANLRGADLRDADLQDANLRDADLRDADLRDADLRDADLQDEDIKKNKIPQFASLTLNEYIKKYSIEKDGVYIFAYKGVTNKLQSPLQTDNPLTYSIGKTISVDIANTDIYEACGHGINLSPTIGAAKEFGEVIIKVKIHVGDIACIPFEDKKFRVKKCKVIEKVKL